MPEFLTADGQIDRSKVPPLIPVAGDTDCIAGWIRGEDLYPDTSKLTPTEFAELAARVNSQGYDLLDENGKRIGAYLPGPGRGVQLDS